jgi:hypothetical protein
MSAFVHQPKEHYMTSLKALTFAALPKLSSADPITHRRNKLIGRLKDQIALAQDPNYVLTRQKWVPDQEGVKQLRSLPKRVRAWWRSDAAGNVVLKVVYGSRVIEWEKGKAAIAVGKKENLIPTIELLITVVASGEIDGLLTQMSKTAVLSKGRRAA